MPQVFQDWAEWEKWRNTCEANINIINTIIYELWIYNAWIWCIIVYLFLSVLSYHVTSNRIVSHSQEQKCLAARMLQKGHLGSLCQAWPRCCCKQLVLRSTKGIYVYVYIYIWCVYISSIHISHQSSSIHIIHLFSNCFRSISDCLSQLKML